MADMEVHEHVVVDGATMRLKNPLVHRNVESLSRYIQKHDEYSNWEALVLLQARGKQLRITPDIIRHTGADAAAGSKRSSTRCPARRFCFSCIGIFCDWDLWTVFRG